jgi:hypothetical protein
MKPDASTPSRQGSGTRTDKSGKTVAPRDLPGDHRELEGVDEGVTEGALPPSSGEPNTTGVTGRGGAT